MALRIATLKKSLYLYYPVSHSFLNFFFPIGFIGPISSGSEQHACWSVIHVHYVCSVCKAGRGVAREREGGGGGNKRGCQRDSWRRPLKHGGSNGQEGGLGKGGGRGGGGLPATSPAFQPLDHSCSTNWIDPAKRQLQKSLSRPRERGAGFCVWPCQKKGANSCARKGGQEDKSKITHLSPD